MGGIGLFETDLNVESSEFLNCQSSGAGGALSAQDGCIIIVGCTFKNCSPGAVALFGNQGGPVDYAEIRDCCRGDRIVGSGVYFVRMSGPGWSKTRKIVVLD